MTETAVITSSVLKESWGQAISLWLESREAGSTRRAYAKALEDLLCTSGKLPEEITRTDLIRWVQELKKRGMSPATIATRLAGISSFFHFCIHDFIVDDPTGAQTHLVSVNPASNGKMMRPHVQMYGKSIWLSAEESRALLRAVGEDRAKAGAAGVRALRDYALFLGYILLARRNSEWRQARWGDFDQRAGHIEYKWSGKGKTDQRLEVPGPLWKALLEYLKAAKKLPGIKAEEFIFTALRDKMPLPGGRVTDIRAPISAHEVGRLIKRYAVLAGLEPERIHPHILRHTGAMLRREAGSSPEQVQQFLGHANMATTQIYLHTLEGKNDQAWARVCSLLGLDL